MTSRILVVEDNPDNRVLITDVLTSLDYEVIVAVDGEEGVAKASSEKPDLILFTGDKSKMGEFVNTWWIKVLAWVTASIIVVLNLKYLLDFCGISDWLMRLMHRAS